MGGLLLSKLVLAKDALKVNGTFPRTPQFIEECQCPEAFDPILVQGSIVICTFSAGFYNETSTLTAIINTARTLGFVGFALLAKSDYGDYIAEPIPFDVPGILIPKVSSSQVPIISIYCIQDINTSYSKINATSWSYCRPSRFCFSIHKS